MDRKQAYKDYLKSEQWAIIRCDMIVLYKGICSRCEKKAHTPFIHHLTYDNIFHEEPEDLTLLCRRCHKWVHGLFKKKRKKIKRAKSKIKKVRPAVWKYI